MIFQSCMDILEVGLVAFVLHCFCRLEVCGITIIIIIIIIIIMINIYIAQIPCEYDQMRVTKKYDTFQT